MSEKVLGFKKKDAAINTEFYRGVKYCPAYLIEISKLVPVVSVEELEEAGKQLILEDETWYKDKSYIEGINDLLFIIHKAVEEKE